jgi:hypothetical protein
LHIRIKIIYLIGWTLSMWPSLFCNIDWNACPRVMEMILPEARAISFPLVCTTTQGQSVYPDIALHISNYCVYCIEDQNLTHDIHYKCIEICNRDHIFNWMNTLHVTFTILQYRLECWYTCRPVQKPCIDWYYWSIHGYLFVYIN